MITNVFNASRRGRFDQAQDIMDGESTEEDPTGNDDDHGHNIARLAPYQAWCLYMSHFLSMWNSRSYEYSAV